MVARGQAAAGTVSWDEFLARANDGGARRSRSPRRAPSARDDPSDILFTSGTTGIPKGVVMTHGRTLLRRDRLGRDDRPQSDDRYLMVNPYFHMFGLKAGILACIASGATMLPEPVFDVDRVLARVAAERVTVLPGPPTLYQSILDHPDRGRLDLSSLRVAVTGAADIPVRAGAPGQRGAAVLHARLRLRAHRGRHGQRHRRRPTTWRPSPPPSDGRAQASRYASSTTPATTLPPGETGEILLRGGSVMSHYLDDPEATAATLSAGRLAADRRPRHRSTTDGLLRIVGRTKDMFIVGGFNVYPAEIENALRRHPDIRDAAVIGIPDPRLGEVGMAFVVAASRERGDGAGHHRVVAASRWRTTRLPRVVEIIDELPLNATGKVAKQELRARAAKGV